MDERELTGIVQGLDEALYHAHPALSSTGVRRLLPEYRGSPKKFQWALTHPRTSRAFDIGHAVHAKVLGVGAGIITYPAEHLTPGGNPSTKAATVAWEDEQRTAGFTMVSPDDAAKVDGMAEAVLAHESARLYFEVAEMREVSVFAEIDGVPVRARFDALSGETRHGYYAVDLKTTDDATENGFMHSVKKWGYDVQDGHYEATFEASEGHGIDQFYFVAVERAAPHEVGVFRLTDQWVQMGKKKAERAREIFAEASSTGVWPGYNPTPIDLAPPTYAVIDYEFAYENGEINI